MKKYFLCIPQMVVPLLLGVGHLANASENIDRDAVGDLNAQSVKAGDFPGSFLIPGTGKVSLALGGFIKSVAIYDTRAEQMGADFLPATLGSSSPDTQGGFSIDSALTRFHVEGRAPVDRGQVTGYIEYDLNGGNNGSVDIKMRHAYGSWINGAGTLTAGHTWSTFMDLKILPEGLTEPTVSGVIFQRQPMIRWTQDLGPNFIFHAAIEDPNSADVFSSTTSRSVSSIPDGILGIEAQKADRRAHLRLNGIIRRVEIAVPNDKSHASTAAGVALTGHLDFLDADKLAFSGLYGRGLGRYLLGIESTSGLAFNPAVKEIELRTNYGGTLSYRHSWSKKTRSTLMAGQARSKPLNWQAGTTFERSSYAAINCMWSVQPYLTLGMEYAYGRKDYENGSYQDNQRFAVGVQIF